MARSKNASLLVSFAVMVVLLPSSVVAQDTTMEPQEIRFSGLATFDIQVRDRAEAIQWLSQVLGFTHLFTEETLNWAEVRSPVTNVTIGIEEIRDRPVRTSSIDFGVRDIHLARAAIEARGGVFVSETIDYGPVLVARLRDPSGNMFNLFQGK